MDNGNSRFEFREKNCDEHKSDILGVMSGRFQPGSYISVLASKYFGVKLLKAVIIISERKGFAQHFAFGGLDKAVVLVLGNVDTNQNHNTNTFQN